MKKEAIVHIELPSRRQLETLLKAIGPEAERDVASRSKVHLEAEGNVLVMRFWATDVSALRATMNSYLRWVILVKNLYDVVDVDESKCV